MATSTFHFGQCPVAVSANIRTWIWSVVNLALRETVQGVYYDETQTKGLAMLFDY